MGHATTLALTVVACLTSMVTTSPSPATGSASACAPRRPSWATTKEHHHRSISNAEEAAIGGSRGTLRRRRSTPNQVIPGRVPDISTVMNTPRTPRDDARLARFDRVFRERYEAVRRHAVRCGSSDPDDIAAEAFAALWRRLDDVTDGSERAWLLGAARRLVANQRRGSARRDALADAVAAHARSVPTEPPAGDPTVAVALAALRPIDRDVLLLQVWDELEPAEIATVLGISRSAAAVRLHRARKRFREAHTAAAASPTTPSTVGGIDAR